MILLFSFFVEMNFEPENSIEENFIKGMINGRNNEIKILKNKI